MEGMEGKREREMGGEEERVRREGWREGRKWREGRNYLPPLHVSEVPQKVLLY